MAAWSDRPTKNQISAIWYLAFWAVPLPELKEALKWLEENATRKQVSDELGRIRELKIARNLTHDEFYNSSIWGNFYQSKLRKES